MAQAGCLVSSRLFFLCQTCFPKSACACHLSVISNPAPVVERILNGEWFLDPEWEWMMEMERIEEDDVMSRWHLFLFSCFKHKMEEQSARELPTRKSDREPSVLEGSSQGCWLFGEKAVISRHASDGGSRKRGRMGGKGRAREEGRKGWSDRMQKFERRRGE